MTDLLNTQLTEMLISQNKTLQALALGKTLLKKKWTKTFLKDVKPSVTFEEFMDNIEILSPTKLLNTLLPDYYAFIILHNIEKYEVSPIVCADGKKKKYFYYSHGEWKSDKEFLKLVRNKIFKLVAGELYNRKIATHYNEEICLCISYFFDVDKYPNEKLLEKLLVKLGKIMPSNNQGSDSDEDSD